MPSIATGEGTLLVVFDNGWDSAPDFALRREIAEAVIEDAARNGRPVALVASAESRGEPVVAGAPETAMDRLAAIELLESLPGDEPIAVHGAPSARELGEHLQRLVNDG